MRIQMAQFECGHHVHASISLADLDEAGIYYTGPVRAITFLAGCKPITYVKDRI